MWKPSSSMHIIDVDLNCYMVRFGDEKDYFIALTGGPWLILDHYLIVQQWDPSFRVSDKLPSKMVVWVRFPHLPIHLYHKQILSSLGNLIGHTVRMDHNTQTAERGKFARITVEIDLNEPLVTGIDLDGAWQRVEYENLPELCFSCGKVGDEKGSCPLLLQAITLPTDVDAAVPVPEPPSKQLAGEAPSDGYGPWLTVTRNPRRAKQENQPRKKTIQKGKAEDFNARSKADGMMGKSNFGKSKDLGEGSSPPKSSHAKDKESNRPVVNAPKGKETGLAKGPVKIVSRNIGQDKSLGPKVQVVHTPKASHLGKGPTAHSSSTPGPSGLSDQPATQLATDGHPPSAPRPKTDPLKPPNLLFGNPQATPPSSSLSSSLPVRQWFKRSSPSPPSTSIPIGPNLKKPTRKKRGTSKGAKNLILNEILLAEKEKADALAAKLAEAGNISLTSFLNSLTETEEMVIEASPEEAGNSGWDLNNPSAENS
ncbi:hypothetical protein LINPERHAP1_LOCUS39048 [Linum perenne]